MKGIIECVTWMVENKNKKLKSSERTMWYNGFGFRFRLSLEGSEVAMHVKWFKILDRYEWTPVATSVDFDTAKADCKKNGTPYKSYDKGYTQNLKMDRDNMGHVRITDMEYEGRPSILDVEWTPV